MLLLATAAGCRAPMREISASHALVCPDSPPRARPLAAGVFLGDDAADSTRMRHAIDEYAALVGRAPAYVKVYHNLSDRLGTGTRGGGRLRAIVAAGSIPMISLEPTWTSSAPLDPITRIFAGHADSLLSARAIELASLTLPPATIIELAAEMNARFGAPWQAVDSSSSFGPRYVGAWRRIVTIFRRSGVNATWLWSPSAGNPYTHRVSGESHWNSHERYYPGDDVVDAVGLHAFNDPEGQGAWVPFVELVDGDAADRMLTSLVMRHPNKPLIIGELASAESRGDPAAKARWITNAYREMGACAAVTAVIWFDVRKERDWRVESSRRSLDAYRRSVR